MFSKIKIFIYLWKLSAEKGLREKKLGRLKLWNAQIQECVYTNSSAVRGHTRLCPFQENVQYKKITYQIFFFSSGDFRLWRSSHQGDRVLMAFRNPFFHQEIAGYRPLQSCHQGDRVLIDQWEARIWSCDLGDNKRPGKTISGFNLKKKNQWLQFELIFSYIYLNLPEFSWIYLNLPEFIWIYLNLHEST